MIVFLYFVSAFFHFFNALVLYGEIFSILFDFVGVVESILA